MKKLYFSSVINYFRSHVGMKYNTRNNETGLNWGAGRVIDTVNNLALGFTAR